MDIYIYIYIMYVYIHIYIYIYVHIDICMLYVRMYMCVYVFLCSLQAANAVDVRRMKMFSDLVDPLDAVPTLGSSLMYVLEFGALVLYAL